MTDPHKSHYMIPPSKQISVHPNDCLAKINNRKGSVSSGVVLISFCNQKKECANNEASFSIKKKGVEVDERTAELHSKKGNTDISELVVIDEMTQWSPCTCRSYSARIFFRKKGNVQRQVMLRLRSLQWRRGRTRGHAGFLSPESLDYQVVQHHFRKTQNHNFAGLCIWMGKIRRPR